jgi:hypothetical protein
MARDYHRILMLFVDGVGLAPASADNPFAAVRTPALESLLGGSLTSDQERVEDDLVLLPLDATLGVDGLPQSATGQASLFTGRNGAARLGRHQTGLPGPRMRELVEEEGLLLRARRAGLDATFANAYSQDYLRDLQAGRRRPSVTTCAAMAAGVELPMVDDLRRDHAVSWDYCRDHFGAGTESGIESIPAPVAGSHLVLIAGRHDLTVHESFLTDLAGHLKRGVSPSEAVVRLDGVIAGIEAHRPEDVTWILTSDHGNLEDTSQGSHTRNPVPLLAVGPGAHGFLGAKSILDVAPMILRLLGAPA